MPQYIAWFSLGMDGPMGDMPAAEEELQEEGIDYEVKSVHQTRLDRPEGDCFVFPTEEDARAAAEMGLTVAEAETEDIIWP